MDVWGSQATDGAAEEEEQWEQPESGRDALLVLVDVRAAMAQPCAGGSTWLKAVVELLVRLTKSKVVASDNSLLGVIFFGSAKRGDASALEGVYEFQPLGYPSAQRIKDLQALADVDVAAEFEAMSSSDPLPFSNALWQCGISFSNANLKKKDTQRVWIFTNDDNPTVPDAEEASRVQKQVQNHAELKRTLNLFFITPPGEKTFDLSKFYSCAFKDFTNETEDTEDADSFLQPAFSISSLDDMMEGSLRKRFRKRRLTTLPLHITKDVSIGVEMYALTIKQRKSYPVALDATSNAPLKTETKWLCEDTGAYLTPDQIKRYIDFGGKRVYFSPDDIVEIKHYDSPSLQLICFKPLSTLKWNENIRTAYFLYPCDGYIEGSTVAFMSILTSMAKKQKFALARMTARKVSVPRLVALLPQEEECDELGQVQPSGFNVIFLPYLDDIRDIPAERCGPPSDNKIDAAKALIAKLKLSEVPTFENPELQKHYSAIQALALGEDVLEFDEAKDTTLPDKDGFGQSDVKDAIESFREACGGDLIDASDLKRKSTTSSRSTGTKKRATTSTAGNAVAVDSASVEEWAALVASNAVQKKTVAELKAFLHAHSLPVSGKKAELIDAVKAFVSQ